MAEDAESETVSPQKVHDIEEGDALTDFKPNAF